MHNDSIKIIAEAYTDRVWNKKDLRALDDFLHEEVVIHSLFGDFHGLEFMKKVVDAWLTGFPDLIVNNIAVICENDTVVIQWQAKGTHKGEFKGKKPTGKRVSYAGVSIYRIRDGKIVEYWAYLDMQHLLNQISV